MGAFVLAAAHLQALTHYAFANGVEDLDSFADRSRAGETHRDTFGRLLLEENIRSVRARYDEDVVTTLVGTGPVDFEAAPADAELHDHLTILHACQCYDYQCCETGDYRTTWAAGAVDRIRRVAAAGLLGDIRIPDHLSGWPIRTASPVISNGLAPRYHCRASR